MILVWGYWARAILQNRVLPTTLNFAGVKFSQPVSIALQRLGIHDKPSPIQAAAIAPICSGLSCILHAPTGSGKTFAFALPALQRLAIPNLVDNNGRAIIIAPTEELVLQINHDIETLSGDKTLSAVCTSKTKKGSLFRRLQTSSLLIGTAQHLLDYLRSDEGRPALKNLCYLVLDEVDRLVPVKNRYTGLASDTSHAATADILRLLVENDKKLQVVAVSSTVGRPLHRSLFHMISPLLIPHDSAGNDDKKITELFPIIRPIDVQAIKMDPRFMASVSHTHSIEALNSGDRPHHSQNDVPDQQSSEARVTPSRYITVPQRIRHIMLACPSDISLAKRLSMITSFMRASAPSTHRTLIFLPTPADVTQGMNILKCWKVRNVYSVQEAKAILKESSSPNFSQNMTIVAPMSISRGLHLPGITTVFASQPPSSMDEYLHVAGRAGRLECIYHSHQQLFSETPSMVTVANAEEVKRMVSWQTPLGIDFQYG